MNLGVLLGVPWAGTARCYVYHRVHSGMQNMVFLPHPMPLTHTGQHPSPAPPFPTTHQHTAQHSRQSCHSSTSGSTSTLCLTHHSPIITHIVGTKAWTGHLQQPLLVLKKNHHDGLTFSYWGKPISLTRNSQVTLLLPL